MPHRVIVSSALALFREPGPCVVFCVTVLVTGALAAYVVKQIAASKPSIEWHNKGADAKIDFTSKPKK